MKQKIIDYRNKLGSTLNQPAERCAGCTVISNDCWGGTLYQDRGWEYRTPFVGLAIMAPCYLQLLSDLDRYVHSTLRFKDVSKYTEMNELRTRPGNRFPIGVLGDDLEIHFMHYQSEAEVTTKWSRRVRRMNWNQMVFKFSADKDQCTPELLKEFNELKFPVKIAFSKNAHPELQSVVQVKNYVINGAMLYRRSICYFDLPTWLESGVIRKSSLRTLVNKGLYSFGA